MMLTVIWKLIYPTIQCRIKFHDNSVSSFRRGIQPRGGFSCCELVDIWEEIDTIGSKFHTHKMVLDKSSDPEEFHEIVPVGHVRGLADWLNKFHFRIWGDLPVLVITFYLLQSIYHSGIASCRNQMICPTCFQNQIFSVTSSLCILSCTMFVLKGSLQYQPRSILPQIIYPILHRQTFERQVYIDRLHLSNRRFGAVVLVVCALGSRLSVDSRNLYDGTTNLRSAGWKYFEQIRLVETNYAAASTLHDIQLYSVRIVYHCRGLLPFIYLLAISGLSIPDPVSGYRLVHWYVSYTIRTRCVFLPTQYQETMNVY